MPALGRRISLQCWMTHPREELMQLVRALEQEADGPWLADVPSLPGVMSYGQSADQRARSHPYAPVLVLGFMITRTAM